MSKVQLVEVRESLSVLEALKVNKRAARSGRPNETGVVVGDDVSIIIDVELVKQAPKSGN